MFRIPGVIPVYIASIFGRLPNGALSLVLLLRTREMTGSYAAGGVVAAASGLALGVSSPVLGRLIDRRGQRQVLLLSCLASTAALAGFAALPDDTPLAVAILVATLAGASTPPLNSCLRALLAAVIPPELRHRAFAIDSTMFELVYISGPLMLVGVIGAWSLRAAVASCAVLTFVGTVVFASTRLSRAITGTPASPHDIAGPLRHPGVQTLLTSVLLFGLAIAGLEVGLAAFAEHEGHTNAVGYLLGLSGVGSMVGGLVAARTRPPADPARRLAVLLLGLAVLEVPLGIVGSLPAMAVAVTVAGFGIAPSLALTFQLTSEVAPTGTVTEAMTWLTSAIAGGLAAGSALAGWLVEHTGTTPVLFTVAVYGAVAAAVVASRTAGLATT
ncbi:MAG: hypothetical protein QOI80_3629 [Solirubrobacteraceae bacterium]|nr:hypothetical protein [Solirubrobacteraceae bacterium]